MQFLACDDETARAVPMFMVNIYYKREYEKISLDQLLEISKSIKFRLSEDDINFIKRLTLTQSNSWHWEKLRAGRVTGCTFKKACTTNLSKPAKSTIMRICYPEKSKFTSNAVEYGKKWEESARKEFIAQMESEHNNFTFLKTGLIISKVCNFFGVSPDGIVSCSCCGKSVLEIKCPYVLKPDDATVEKLLKLSTPYIKLENG